MVVRGESENCSVSLSNSRETHAQSVPGIYSITGEREVPSVFDFINAKLPGLRSPVEGPSMVF